MAVLLNSYGGNDVSASEYNNVNKNIIPYANIKNENLTLYFNNSDCCFPKRVIIMNNINKFTFVQNPYCLTVFMIVFSLISSLACIFLPLIFTGFGLPFLYSLEVECLF